MPLIEIPKNAKGLLVLAHGAGAGMDHPSMTTLSEALHSKAIGTYRFNFPYMARGSKRPDSPEVATSAVAEAVRAARKEAPKLPLFAGGRSFGGRMTTMAASAGKIPEVEKILCFAFPLHPAKAPSSTRAAHFEKILVPTLFLNGTRDDLAELSLLRKTVKPFSKITIHVLEGADHSFHVLKSSGRTSAEVMEEIAQAAKTFCFT